MAGPACCTDVTKTALANSTQKSAKKPGEIGGGGTSEPRLLWLDLHSLGNSCLLSVYRSEG